MSKSGPTQVQRRRPRVTTRVTVRAGWAGARGCGGVETNSKKPAIVGAREMLHSCVSGVGGERQRLRRADGTAAAPEPGSPRVVARPLLVRPLYMRAGGQGKGSSRAVGSRSRKGVPVPRRRKQVDPVSPPSPPVPPSVPVIHPRAVYTGASLRAVLCLKESSLAREVRLGRLMVHRRCGRNFYPGHEVLAWLRAGPP